MTEREEWISLKEMDYRIAKNKESFEAVKQLIVATDWGLLREQYEWLAQQAETARQLIPEDTQYYQSLTAGFIETRDMAEGLLGFLEAIKDLAVDHFGVDAVTVYGEEQE